MTGPTQAPAGNDDHGVVFPVDADGRRGSSATVRAVLVDALGELSRDAAARAASEPSWHTRYPDHVAALVRESLAAGPAATVAAARAGLQSLHGRLQFVRGAQAAPLRAMGSVERATPFRATTLRGEGDPAPRALAIPYRDEMLAGDRLARRLEQWVREGIVEPSHAHAVREVAAHPQWLDLSDRSFVLLGASAEVSPLAWLAGWRARIVAVDLPAARPWKRIEKFVARGNATLIAPVREDGEGATGAGANLLTDLPEILDWLASLEGPLTVGAYAYLDGSRHVRVAAAMDALMARLCELRSDVSLAALATPTDAYAVPDEAVQASRAAWAARGVGERSWQAPIAALSRGRFFRPNHPPGSGCADYGICDSLVLQQGPNYALAKRLQQWRALVARADGVRVSINVAPSTTTHSVVKNPALRAAFAGAHRFGVESFDAATTSALMAALLVYDLRSDESAANPAVSLPHPLELLMHGANHGGMWRMPFKARSALPFAALLGFLRLPGR